MVIAKDFDRRASQAKVILQWVPDNVDDLVNVVLANVSVAVHVLGEGQDDTQFVDRIQHHKSLEFSD